MSMCKEYSFNSHFTFDYKFFYWQNISYIYKKNIIAIFFS